MIIRKEWVQKLAVINLFHLFVLISILQGQEGSYTLQWLPNGIDRVVENGKVIQSEYFKFKDAIYDENFIPRYSASFKVNSGIRNFELTNIKYEIVPDTILRKIKLPDVLPCIEPTQKVYRSGKNVLYLDIAIQALRQNPGSGKIEKLISYEIDSNPVAVSEFENKEFTKDKSLVNSLLVSGNWYKIKVSETGIYKLTYADLVSIGFTNPSDIRVYGNGGRQLSYWNDDPRPIDLNEIPIYMSKGSDGIFNEGDFILFYAEGTVTWDIEKWKGEAIPSFFKESIHGYSDAIYYFLTTSQGPANVIQTVDNRELADNIAVSSFNDFTYYEKENLNLIGSGRTWYTSRIDGAPFDSVFSFPDHVTNANVRVEVKTAGRSTNTRYSFLKIDGYVVDTFIYSTITAAYSWSTFAKEGNFYYDFNLTDESFNLGVDYFKVDYADECYLNNITINTRSKLNVRGNPYFFRDLNSVGAGNVAGFNITNVASNSQVWDITHLNNVIAIQGELSGSNYFFKADAGTLHEYVVVDPDYDYPKPVISDSERGVGEVPNQNLRGLPAYNYIIVAPDVFIEQAEKLADFHRSKGELSVLVVTPELIYNEFSSGTPDVSALRDFFRHQFLKADGENMLRYVLLFGDGSFNNRSYAEGNTNYILTYQSINSLNPSDSYVSDDFFGLLDEGVGGSELDGKMDIGVGRLTVKLVDGEDFEADDVVNKILAYDTCRSTDWRRVLCFVADDGFDAPNTPNGHQFMESSDLFTDYIEENYPGFEFRKLYLDAYPQINTATGATYPDVKRELKDLFNKGILVMNYFGHGSENQITSESVLTKQDVMSMKNEGLLPLIITGSCSVSKYDQVETEENNEHTIIAKTSMGEEALLNPEGGAIALLSTTRVVDQNPNESLVSRVFAYLFLKNEFGKPFRLGDVVKLAKNDMGNDYNKHNFSLLGDPALTLAYPQYLVCTDSINHISVDQPLDTLKAFGMVAVSGFVAFDDSTLMSDFNGFVYPQVYDKKINITTFGNDNVDPYVYQDQKNLLYKGKATVTNGRFSFSFIVPKDIAYNIDKGKISYYAENGIIDAKGEFRGVNIGGTVENPEDDVDGPDISLYMNDEHFEEGGITNKNPFIHALMYDLHGINTSGAGIGHDIIGVLDGDEVNPYVLNDYYEATIDTYHEGIVRYQLNDLKEGQHELAVKAWDVYDNSSETSVGFVVEASDGLVLDKVLNYPNPTNDFTWFQYSHNMPDEIHDVTLEVFDISGRLVTRIEQKQFESGFVSTPIYWDLRSSGGEMLSPGVYPYRLKVTTPVGTGYINQKLIILR
jgi:hypothetical protein